eukprot:1143171-Pleurochrysis_carterae.AAC.1
MPFWPMYCNGQGATPRELEPNKWRRTTEGGGPRRDVADATGIQALSINAASKIHYFPHHFQDDERPEFLAWLAAKQLPRTNAQRAAEANARSKWPREV